MPESKIACSIAVNRQTDDHAEIIREAIAVVAQVIRHGLSPAQKTNAYSVAQNSELHCLEGYYLSLEKYAQLLSTGQIDKAILTKSIQSLKNVPQEMADLQLAMLEIPEAPCSAQELQWFELECLANDKEFDEVKFRGCSDSAKAWLNESLSSGDGDAHRFVRYLERSHFGKSFARWTEQDWRRADSVTVLLYCRQIARESCSNTTPVVCRETLFSAKGGRLEDLTQQILVPFCSAFAQAGTTHARLPHLQLGFFEAFLKSHSKKSLFEENWRRQLRGHVDLIRKRKLSAANTVHAILKEWNLSKTEIFAYVFQAVLSLRSWARRMQKITRGAVSVTRRTANSDNEPLVEFLAARLIVDRAVLSSYGEASTYPRLCDYANSHSLTRQTGAADVATRTFWLYRIATHLGWTPCYLSRLKQKERKQVNLAIDEFSKRRRQQILQDALERTQRQHLFNLFRDHLNRRAGYRESIAPHFQLLVCAEPCEEPLRSQLESNCPGVETYGVPGFFNVAVLFKNAQDSRTLSYCPANVRLTHFVEETLDSRGMTLELNGPAHQMSVAGSFEMQSIHGYTTEEMATVVQQLLEDAGVGPIAPLVIVMGHSWDGRGEHNPSGPNCSLCNNHSGAPNARILAKMANDQNVRKIVEAQGLCIPPETRFVAAEHCISTHTVRFFEAANLPVPLRPVFFAASDAIRSAARQQPKKKVPCFEHAVCIVGRRELTHELHLARPTYLYSYDATFDDHERLNLSRLLSVIVPHCCGANLEQWSVHDKHRHVSTSPFVPTRMTMIIDASPESLLQLMAVNKLVGRYFTSECLHLAAYYRGRLYEYGKGIFLETEVNSHKSTTSERTPRM